MTKKKRRPARRQRRFPWVLLVIGGILLAVAALLFANRGSSDTGGTPAISVDPKSMDYGDLKLGTNETFSIKVSNTGSGTLRFKEKPYIQVLEGC